MWNASRRDATRVALHRYWSGGTLDVRQDVRHTRGMTTAAQTVTIHGQQYVFTPVRAYGILGSLWLDNSDDTEDDGHPDREWAAYVRENPDGSRYLQGGVYYDVLDAETELAPLSALVGS